MKASKAVVAILMSVLLGAMMIGCQSDSPVSVPAVPEVQNAPVTGNTELDCWVTPIALPRSTAPKPVVSRSIEVTSTSGDTVDATLEYTNASTGKTVRVHAIFMVPAGAVSGQKTITMTMDTSVVGVKFAPKGLWFYRTPTLFIEAYNLDPIPWWSSVGLYYFDDYGNAHMQLAGSIVRTPTSLKMVAARIPHFSAYAFGR